MNEIKLTKKVVSYVNKNKEEKKAFNFYVVVNGNRIAIKPSFENDYRTLAMISESED